MPYAVRNPELVGAVLLATLGLSALLRLVLTDANPGQVETADILAAAHDALDDKEYGRRDLRQMYADRAVHELWHCGRDAGLALRFDALDAEGASREAIACCSLGPDAACEIRDITGFRTQPAF